MSTSTPVLQVLLIEDNPDDAVLLRELLHEALPGQVGSQHCLRLAEGLAALAQGTYQAVFLDLNLPDSRGLATLAQLRQAAPHLPVIVLTGWDDEDTAISAVTSGAQDYLIKGKVDAARLASVVTFALARHQRQAAATTTTRAPPTTTTGTADLSQTEVLPGYRFVRSLGGGASAEVYLVQRLAPGETGNVYALKLLQLDHLGAAAQAEVRRRFAQEAHVATRCQHEHLVRVFEFSFHASGPLYLLMEYVEGRPLDLLLPSLPPHAYGVKLQLLRDVAAGLAALHAEGFCHRDLKPKNILVTTEQRAKLCDFGVAGILGVRPGSRLVGSPAYMPPEAFTGEPLLPAGDVFSLGVVAYEMFTGRRPFTALSEVDLAERVQHERPVRPTKHDPNLPAGIEPLLARLLAKRLADRYPDARAALADIDAVIAGQPPGPLPRLPRWWEWARRPWR